MGGGKAESTQDHSRFGFIMLHLATVQKNKAPSLVSSSAFSGKAVISHSCPSSKTSWNAFSILENLASSHYHKLGCLSPHFPNYLSFMLWNSRSPNTGPSKSEANLWMYFSVGTCQQSPWSKWMQKN